MQFCQSCRHSNSYCHCYSKCRNYYSPDISFYCQPECKPCYTTIVEKVHCPSPHPDPPVKNNCKPVCNNTCGNILLDDVTELRIWRERLLSKPTVTISVFNSSSSLASILVRVIRNSGNSVEFIVPPGNTLTRTVENTHEITVIRQGAGRTNGKYCLDVCFPFQCHDKSCHKKHRCSKCGRDLDWQNDLDNNEKSLWQVMKEYFTERN